MNNDPTNRSLNDVQVNIRFNKDDYQKLQDIYKKYIVSRCEGKVPTVQTWIKETMLTL